MGPNRWAATIFWKSWLVANFAPKPTLGSSALPVASHMDENDVIGLADPENLGYASKSML